VAWDEEEIESGHRKGFRGVTLVEWPCGYVVVTVPPVDIVIMTITRAGAMSKRVSTAAAKAQFAEYIRRAESGEEVVITRHGRAVAAIIAGARSSLRAARGKAGLAGLAGGWKGSDELVKALKTHTRTSRRIPE
jgi:prevent-host-death family protein